jgi:hypothetical protein
MHACICSRAQLGAARGSCTTIGHDRAAACIVEERTHTRVRPCAGLHVNVRVRATNVVQPGHLNISCLARD